MKDGKIYIVVTDDPSGGQGTPPESKPKKKKDSKEILAHWARDKVISETKQLINTAVNFQINNIGNFTGNYLVQANIQETISAARSIAGIGTAAAAGFVATAGNPLGAVIGASIAILNTGISYGQQIYLQSVQQAKADRELAILRERSGLNQWIDWSRGTEN